MKQVPTGAPYRVHFYQTPQGKEPVREWLRRLGREERRTLGEAIQTLQWLGPGLSMPQSLNLGRGLFELRERMGRVRFRIFYAFDGATLIVLLHAATKDQRTIPEDVALARKRLKEYFERKGE